MTLASTCSLPLCSSCTRSIQHNPSYTPSPQLNEALRRGCVPADDSLLDRIARAKDAEQQADEIGQELERLEALAETLRMRQRELSQFSAQQHGLMTPIRRLPVELLEIILRCACVDDIVEFPFSPRTVSAHAINGVCHLWRSIIQDSGLLWSAKIRIDGFRPFADDRQDRDARLFRRVLGRYCRQSAPGPLSVELLGDPRDIWASCLNDNLRAALEVIFRFLPRWRTAILSKHMVDYLHTYLKANRIKRRPEMLEAVEVARAAPTSRCRVKVFANATRLRSWTQHIDHCRFRLPYAQLTYLHTSWLSSLTVWEILQRCRGLEELRLSVYIEPSVERWRLPKFSLPRLKRLVMTADDPYSISDLFPVLDVPLLEDLCLNRANWPGEEYPAIDDAWDWPEQECHDFLTRSGCNLRKFELNYVRISEVTLWRLRERLPSATQLVAMHTQGLSVQGQSSQASG
ncbi:uncharacterized protein SCHCODRAFT_02746219 [Schizophyllum commune H4-8]|nr:uncharacterized protein SCHCODRAFT_02746219 [Schizophyllum commune H4-8]KAI5894684.1 hypothetical protein SCHCODRAFT_02746219 [Schizophyllum commune H4-8]